jgi:integrase
MPTVRLTDRLLKNLKTEKKQEDFWDEAFPGTFGLRVTDRGSKTFILRYRFGGRRRRLTLGRYPVLSLATARRMALDLLGEARGGEDPSEKRQQEKNAGTFGELAQSYLEMHAIPHKKAASIKEDTRILNTYLLPAWGRRKFQSITRSDVIGLLDEIKLKRGAPVMANRVKALASTIFNFAARKALVPETFANPCTNVEQPTKETSRDRVLSDDEIKSLWEDLEERAEPTASIYRLVLLTGQRPGEVKAMRWCDIDGDNLWTILATETKNHREHRVPLSSHALAVIEQLRSLTGDAEFVFATPSGGHIQYLQKMSQRIQKKVGFNFRPHDLRRTCATNLSKLSVNDVTIATILNHSWAFRHMNAVYNRWQRLPEMKRALERWGTQVERIVTGKSAKKVVKFKR